MRKREKKKLKDKLLLHMPFDPDLLMVVLFLNILGIIMIYSASYYYAESAYGYEPDYFLKNQLKYVAIGLAGMFVLSFIRPTFWRKFRVPALILSVAVILALLIPGFSKSSHGASRWLKIGPLSLQVAEPVKFGMIVFLAGFLVKYDISKKKDLFILGFIAVTVSVMLLVISNNMSSAMIVMIIYYIAIMINHPRQKEFLLILLLLLLLAAAAVLVVDRLIPYSETENFRITRIRAWLHPSSEQYSNDQAFQANLAFYAIASGGFFGRGLGQSLIKFRMPEPHNDYILAIVFEELGIFGVLILTYLIIYLLYKILTVYRNCRNRFSRVLVLGVFLHLASQTVLNYMVTLGLLPTMGVTLPFISAGGTAVMMTLLEIGFVIATQRMNLEVQYYLEAGQEMVREDPENALLLRKSAEKKEKAK